MLRTTTIPLFSYASLPLLPGRYTLTFRVRVHVILPFILASYLSSSLPSQILSPLKLPINPTSSTVTNLGMEQALEKGLSFQLQVSP